MTNNQKFISTINKEHDFEELVRRYVSYIFNADAYLVGGPWDNGKDVVYKVRNREVREALQISIQEKGLESKIEEDFKKVIDLVDNYGYPPILYFFWSHPISETTLDKIREKAKSDYGLTLEFYDAKRIDQDIARKYPDLLNFLIKDIHGLDGSSSSHEMDIKQRAFYEYLLLSKDTANLKNSITDANVLTLLSDGGKDIDFLHSNISGITIKKGFLKSRLQSLTKAGMVNSNDSVYILSDNEKIKIDNIRIKETANEIEVLNTLRSEIMKYTSVDLSKEILALIKKAYEASVDIQINEFEYNPVKNKIVEGIVNELTVLITKNCDLTSVEKTAKDISKDLVDIASSNDYLSEHCSAKLCLSLLSDRKFERYIEDKSFFIYLDATVLIPYILALRFNRKNNLFDRSVSNISLMKDSIFSLKNKSIRVSNEHFEESVRHLEQAGKIAGFAKPELIRELGGSKNVFLNVYLKWLDEQPNGCDFNDFLYYVIGFEFRHTYPTGYFDALSVYLSDFVRMNSINIINYESVRDDFLAKVKTKFIRAIAGRRRANRAIDNDIISSALLGDESYHIDNNGIFNAPMIITLDSAQYDLRQSVRALYPDKEWLVYTPQRAIERLSMLGMKISPSTLRDGVLATISENYFFKENTPSLIDSLSFLVGEDKKEQGDIVDLVTKLKRKVIGEDIAQSEIDIIKYNVMNEVLIYTHREFYTNLSIVRSLFSDDKVKGELIDILYTCINSDFGDEKKNEYKDKLTALINKKTSNSY